MLGTGDAVAPSVAERAPWVLDDLAGARAAAPASACWRAWMSRYLEKQPGPRPVSSFSAAATLPAHATALGPAMLAFSDTDVVDAVLAAGWPTPRTRTPHRTGSAARWRSPG